jgi:phospholipid/cholesterol/gamma-HCH transport system substrate-binding protein
MRRKDEVMVGVFVSFSLVVGVVGTLYLARRGWTKTYPMHARFDWGQNLKIGQPVYLAGVQVGYVNTVELDPAGYLDVSMAIDRDRRIPEGSSVTVQSEGLFGDKAVAIKPCRRPEATTTGIEPPPGSAPMATVPAPVGANPLCRPGSYLAANDTIPSGRPAPSMDDILYTVDSVGKALNDVSRTVRLEFVQNGGIAELRKTIASTNKLVTQLNEVAQVQSKALAGTLASLKRSLDAIDSAAVDSTVRGMAAASHNLAVLTRNLDSTSMRVNSILTKIDSGQGTVGMMLNDAGLYNNLRSLLGRLDSLTAEIKKNPGKYLNVKVF